LAAFATVFTAASLQIFRRMASAWALCPGRHVITRIYQVAEPQAERAHDAYHRFFRAGAWSMALLWKTLATILVEALHPEGRIPVDADDTVFHKTGRKVEGIGLWRDAVRSVGKHMVRCFGLNIVVITLRVRPPWGGEPLGLPINFRLHHRNGATLLDLAEQMICQIASWFPDRLFTLCADGFYAPLAGRPLPRTGLICRIRRDAALYKTPPRPRKKRKRGRPKKKGARLPSPKKIARRKKGWRLVTVDIRGTLSQRLVLVLDVLWYKVCKGQPVRLVISRDPEGVEDDDFFFTTDLSASAEDVVSGFAGRWSIEDTFKNVKQSLRGEDPQSWKGQGPERTAAFSFWLYSAIWFWYLKTHGKKPSWLHLPWYPQKSTPSFADALAALRTALWWQRLFPKSDRRPVPPKIVCALIDVLARAA
jgi:hypothetical protein